MSIEHGHHYFWSTLWTLLSSGSECIESGRAYRAFVNCTPFADLSNSPFYLLWILHLWVMHSLHLCCVCVFKNLKKRVLLIVNSPHRRSRKYTYGSRTAFSDDRSLFFLIMSNWLWIWYTGSYSEHYCCSHFSPAAFNICFDFYTDMEYWTSRGGLVRDCTFAFLMF